MVDVLFEATGPYRLLPKALIPSDAIEYYLKEVSSRRQNIHGVNIMIDPNAVNCLFKPHDVQKGKYQPPRGRRLPWIIPVIERSSIIKLSKGCELYIAEIGVPGKMLGIWVPFPEYYCVLVNMREGMRYFKNAYPLKRTQYVDNLQLADAY